MRPLLALLLSLAIGWSVQARAQTSAHRAEAEPEQDDSAAVESARSHFRLGVDFYRERNFRAALIEFRRAYADAPHYKLLYNLGQASLELQEYAGAIDYLRKYLAEGGDDIDAERRQEVEESIRYLESRIAHVAISSNQQGADIYVDDTLVGRIPLAEPVRVGAGRHKFTAVKQGLSPVERTLDVAAQERRDIRLDFVEQPALVTTPAPVVARPRTEDGRTDESGGSAALWAAATTAALGAGAITMTVIAMLAQKDYDAELESETTRAELDALREDAETKALVTDIAWGATLVSGIVTAVLIVSDDDDEESATRAASGIDVGVGPAGIVVDGRF